MGMAISAYYIGRSLLRPIGILSRAMTKVAEGDLDIRVAGHLQRRGRRAHRPFNAMVEGLREREHIRETFGRYVDESVAATILRRQGDAARARSARPPSCSPTSRASPPSPNTSRRPSWWAR